MSVQSFLICCVEPVTTFTMTITQKQQKQQTFTCNGVVPNSLISQDEPTNNLDLESIDALSEAITNSLEVCSRT